MERTLPRTVSNEIGLYMRTYYSLLRTSGDVAVDTLVEAHASTGSLLHPHAADTQVDAAALIYTSLRLPERLRDTQRILLGQRTTVFERHGYPVETWQPVTARARRRRAYFDGKDTLALYIASRSDIDDILPALTAYQIEWNKMHYRLADSAVVERLHAAPPGEPLSRALLAELAAQINMDEEEFSRVVTAWGDTAVETLQAVAAEPKRLTFNLLAGSLTDYRKAMLQWWAHVENSTPAVDYSQQRVYFVSSNTHSLVNLWSGHAVRQKDRLLAYLEQPECATLKAEYENFRANGRPIGEENFLYYLLKKYQQRYGVDALMEDLDALGVRSVESDHGFDLATQVIPIGEINTAWLDPRLRMPGMELLTNSSALIINIDYPLGLAAYEVLSHIAENVDWVAGVYVMGKAATLNGRIGDVMIPVVVHDEHTDNTYMFDNCFRSSDVAQFLQFGNVLDNQKSVTVPGTFLQNADYMSVFYHEGFTDIEMEAGPYLSAIYELVRPKRHPQNEIVSLHGAPLDLGIIHYASDTPLTKGANLGAGSLSYRGIDPTYAAAIAIMRRIMGREITRLERQRRPVHMVEQS